MGNRSDNLDSTEFASKVIASRTVVSEPGAAITVTEIELTPEARAALTLPERTFPRLQPAHEPTIEAIAAWLHDEGTKGNENMGGSVMYFDALIDAARLLRSGEWMKRAGQTGSEGKDR